MNLDHRSARRLHALKVHNRHARDSAEGRAELRDLLRRKLDDLVDPAFDVASQEGDPIGQLMAEVMTERRDPELAAYIVDRLAEETAKSWALRELEVVGNRLVLEFLEANPGATEAVVFAGLRHNFGAALSSLGQVSEARRVLEQALDFYAHAGPAYADQLAACSNTLSQTYTRLGLLDEAEATARRSVEVALENNAPNQLIAAAFLVDHAAILGDLGRTNESLETALHAVTLFEGAPPNSDLPSAIALILAANRLTDLGRYDEAQQALERAVEMLALVTSESSDGIVPSLGQAHGDLAVLQFRLGLEEQAFASAARACETFEELWSERPLAFQSDFLWSLDLLDGHDLERQAGSRTPIRPFLERMVQLLEDHEQHDPVSAANLRVSTLAVLVKDQLRQNQLRAATKTAELALQVFDGLDPANRMARLREAVWLNLDLSTAFGLRSKTKKAAQAALEAIRLTSDHQNLALTDRVSALDSAATWLFKLGQSSQAFEAELEALRILRSKKVVRSFEVVEHEVISLNHLAIMKHAAGHLEEAISLVAEAAKLLEGQPASNSVDEAKVMTFSHWGLFLFRKLDLAAAEEKLRFALKMWNSMEDQNPELRPHIAEALQVLGSALEWQYLLSEADSCYLQALEICEHLLGEGQEINRVAYGRTLVCRAGLLRRRGLDSEAELLEAKGIAEMAARDPDTILEAAPTYRPAGAELGGDH